MKFEIWIDKIPKSIEINHENLLLQMQKYGPFTIARLLLDKIEKDKLSLEILNDMK